MRVALGGHEFEKARSEITLRAVPGVLFLFSSSSSLGFNFALSMAASLAPHPHPHLGDPSLSFFATSGTLKKSMWIRNRKTYLIVSQGGLVKTEL